MSDETAASSAPVPDQRNAYTFRAAPEVEADFARRSASVEAEFFLPHLRQGMHLLDVGCGPGSITCDLAEVVAPGEVVGLDIQPAQVASAATLAAQRGLHSMRFDVGSVYALPFPDATFHAVFAHQVLVHLSDPLAALREMRRVLKPGGVVGIRDINYRLVFISPPTPLLEAMMALRLRVWQHNGGNPFYASHQRQLLLEAGFVQSEASATFIHNGTLETTRRSAAINNGILRAPYFAEMAITQGWVDPGELDAMSAEVLAWGERPDAFSVWGQCQAVGWNAE